jgi:trans-aconitate methyltransferase
MSTARATWCPGWDGAHYAANQAHHRAHDEWFLDGWSLEPSAAVLDVGCGDGAFTATLAAMVPEGEVVGLDGSASMLEQARQVAGTNQSFVHGSVQDLATVLPVDGAFDVIVSRACLHWVPRHAHPEALVQFARLLRPGGILRVECGGGDNVARMVALLDDVSAQLGGPTQPWTFLDAGCYLEWVRSAGLDPVWVRTVAQHRPFDRAGVLGWLHSQCFQAYEEGQPEGFGPELRRLVEARLDEMRHPDGTFAQTFVRLDVLASAPAD